MVGDISGVAAVEFALTGGVMMMAMLNGVDAATYFYQRMQVQNATQMGAEAAFQACDTAHLPATVNCTGLNAAVQSAVRSSSLGNAVSLQSGSPTEGYYCLNGSNALVYVSNVSQRPANCASVGNASGRAVDYIKIQTSYIFLPIFGTASVANLLPRPITSTAMMRME